MGREHYWKDRVQILRVRKKIVRGEVMGETPEMIGAPIACILVKINGNEAPEGARTYLPETGMLHFMKKDTAGDAVTMRQGDTLMLSYMQDGVEVERARAYKIVGDIVMNRRGREIASLSAQVRLDTEH